MMRVITWANGVKVKDEQVADDISDGLDERLSKLEAKIQRMAAASTVKDIAKAAADEQVATL